MTFFSKIRLPLCLSGILLCGAAHAAEDHFTFVAEGNIAKTDYANIEAELRESRARILSDLGLETMPAVTVRIWRDESAYQDEMEATFGSRAPGSRGYVVGDTELRLLLAGQPFAAREAAHEFVHAASLKLNPTIGNNPRWLWEGAAIYLANEPPNAQAAKFFKRGQCPTLSALNAPFNQGGSIYDVGFYLLDFIAQRWGKQAIPSLIKANGDIETILGISETTFEQDWCAFAREQNPNAS